MITIIKDLPPGIVGARASGEVTADDYRRVLIPAIGDALAGGGRLRLLYHLGPEFTGLDAGAMWQDAKLRIEHMRGFERIALVTDVEWLAGATHAFGWMMPGEVKVYPNASYDDAVSWLGGG